MTKEKLTKVVLGTVGVDAGRLMIFYQCYIKHLTDLHGSDKGWLQYCESINQDEDGNYEGLAIHFSSGYGDGEYTVYGFKNKEGRIMKVEIDMNWDDEDDD